MQVPPNPESSNDVGSRPTGAEWAIHVRSRSGKASGARRGAVCGVVGGDDEWAGRDNNNKAQIN